MSDSSLSFSCCLFPLDMEWLKSESRFLLLLLWLHETMKTGNIPNKTVSEFPLIPPQVHQRTRRFLELIDSSEIRLSNNRNLQDPQS